MPARTPLHFTALMLSALSTGVFFGTWTSLGPSTKSLAPRTYVETQQATVRNLRPVMGPLLPAAVVTSLAVLVLPRTADRSARVLNALGFCGQLASLVLTAAIELPINAHVMTWAPDNPPEGWEGVRNRWARTHAVRAATSVAGLAALLAAEVLRPTRSS